MRIGREADFRRLPSLFVCGFAIATAGMGCRPSTPPPPVAGDSMEATMPEASIRAVLELETPALLRIPGVTGTAEGARDGHPIFLVLVTRRTPALEARIPRRLGGFEVEIQEVGEVRPLGGH